MITQLEPKTMLRLDDTIFIQPDLSGVVCYPMYLCLGGEGNMNHEYTRLNTNKIRFFLGIRCSHSLASLYSLYSVPLHPCALAILR